jgi:Arc/MetJ-type ribon-helix-helix transcriptional regulator
MRKVTVALPEELRRQIENAAKLEGRSISAVMRQAVEEAMRNRFRPKPRIPLTTKELPKPDMAEHFDEYLKGFGRDR